MNVDKIVKELKIKYPGKNIVVNTPENPTEIICEIEPGSENPTKSVAIAVLDNNITHFHRRGKEIYEVIKGVLKIDVRGKTHALQRGQKIEINPGDHHTIDGKETWVKVTSIPAWTSDDHIPLNSG